MTFIDSGVQSQTTNIFTYMDPDVIFQNYDESTNNDTKITRKTFRLKIRTLSVIFPFESEFEQQDITEQ